MATLKQDADEAKGGFFAFTTTRPVTITMVVLAVFTFGYISLGKLPVNLLPEIAYPTITVRTEYPGAGPEDVEERVSERIQEALSVLPGLQEISSISKPELSDVTLEFTWGTQVAFATQNIREKLDRTILPEDAKTPIILRYDPNLDPVIRVGRDGLPLVVFRDDDQKTVKLARCSDQVCTRAVVSVLVSETGRDPGHGIAFVLAPGDVPVVVYNDWFDNGIWIATCTDSACTAVSKRRLDDAADGTSADPSIALDGHGRPLITFRQKLPGDERASRILKIVECEDIACAKATAPAIVDDNGRVGYVSTVQWLPNGEVTIAYGDATGGVLKFAFKAP